MNWLTLHFVVPFFGERGTLVNSSLPHFYIGINRLNIIGCLAPEILPQSSETLPRGGPTAGE